MKKILLGAAATALLFAGCAQNELLEGGVATPNDGKIYFSATSGVPTNTRAASGNPINSTADLQKLTGGFFVKGYVEGLDTPTPLVNANPQYNGTSWEYPGEPYWPNTWMNFLAYANWDAAPTMDGTKITAAVTVAADGATVGTQKDLLVAATYNATKEIRTLLTFKHALTQIVFKAGNLSAENATDGLDVYIGGIDIVNVAATGNMTVDEGGDGKARITWAGQTPQTTTYAVGQIDGTTPDKGFVVPRITTQAAFSTYPRVQTTAEPANNALMLVPQRFSAWDSNNGKAAGDQNNAYIHLKAIILKNGATSEKDWYCGTYSSNIANAGYGDVYIPVSSLANEIGEWVAGKRINYIITFGDKNSGSGAGGYDKDGNPILVPIRFRAVVEDWIETDVPLLTATFGANSTAITNKFINGYVNQMLADVKDAAAPKVINGNINITGTISNEMNTSSDFASLSVNNKYLDNSLANGQLYSSKFRPGSTVTYNLTGVTVWNNKIATLEVPVGWEARTYLGATPAIPNSTTAAAIAAGTDVTLNGTDANKIVLTKIPTRYTVYNTHVDYIEDNIGGLVLNEKSLTGSFATTIFVAGPIPRTNATFSSDMLAELVNATTGATVTLNVAGVTTADWTASKSITTWCPIGWKATVGAATFFPGDPIKLTAATNIVFTKVAGGIAHNYAGSESLKAWLENTNVKASGEVFYYDNVGFDVTIDTGVAPWSSIEESAVVGSVVVKLKYPLSDGKVLEDGKWTYDDTEGEITYTK